MLQWNPYASVQCHSEGKVEAKGNLQLCSPQGGLQHTQLMLHHELQPYQTALMEQRKRNGATNPLTSQKLLLSIRSKLACFSTTVKMQKLRNVFRLFKDSQIKVIILNITQASSGCIHNKAYLHNKYIYLMNMEIKTQQLVFTMHFLHELP